MLIINLTPDRPCATQLSKGVYALSETDRSFVSRQYNFTDLPKLKEIEKRVNSLVDFVKNLVVPKDKGGCTGERCVLIGGEPWFSSCLERQLKESGFRVFYSVKGYVTKHIGFIEV